MTTAHRADRTAPRLVLVGSEVRAALLVSFVLGLVTVVVAALTSGSASAAGATIGALMVLGFFGLGSAAVSAVAAVSPSVSMLVALLTYTLEVVLLALVFVVLNRSGALDSTVDRTWLGLTVIGGTLVWLVGQTVAATRSRQPIYDLPEPAPAPPVDRSEASAR